MNLYSKHQSQLVLDIVSPYQQAIIEYPPVFPVSVKRNRCCLEPIAVLQQSAFSYVIAMSAATGLASCTSEGVASNTKLCGTTLELADSGDLKNIFPAKFKEALERYKSLVEMRKEIDSVKGKFMGDVRAMTLCQRYGAAVDEFSKFVKDAVLEAKTTPLRNPILGMN